MFVQPACFPAALVLFVICAHSIKANDLPSGEHTASVGSWGFDLTGADLAKGLAIFSAIALSFRAIAVRPEFSLT